MTTDASTARSAILEEIQKHLAAETSQDIDALIGSMADDCYTVDVTDPNSPYIGPDAVAERYRALFDTLPDVHVEMKRLIAIDGNIAVTENELSGTHRGTLFGVPPSGRRVSISCLVVWEFNADGEVKGETVYKDLATELRQVGYLSLPDMD